MMKKIFGVVLLVFITSTLYCRHSHAGGGDSAVGGLFGGLAGGMIGSSISQSSHRGDGGSSSAVREIDQLRNDTKVEFSNAYNKMSNIERDVRDLREKGVAGSDLSSITTKLDSLQADVRNVKKSISDVEKRLTNLEEKIEETTRSAQKISETPKQISKAVKKPMASSKKSNIPLIDEQEAMAEAHSTEISAD